MNRIYDIMHHGKKIGRATIEESGLYYFIKCRCYPPDDGIHKIKLQNGQREVMLGTCIPIGKDAGLTKKIPIKEIQTDSDFMFYLDDNAWVLEEGKPLPQLENIAKLRYCDGKLYYSKS